MTPPGHVRKPAVVSPATENLDGRTSSPIMPVYRSGQAKVSLTLAPRRASPTIAAQGLQIRNQRLKLCQQKTTPTSWLVGDAPWASGSVYPTERPMINNKQPEKSSATASATERHRSEYRVAMRGLALPVFSSILMQAVMLLGKK